MVDVVVRYLKTPQWRRQHRWRRALWRTMSRVGLTGMHALPVNRRWVELARQKMPLKGLDSEMAGLKLVQISDLHYSPVVWRTYLLQYIEWINDQRPDLVVVTGDLVTGGNRYATRVAELLAQLRSVHGVVCTFGNHDYSMFGKNGRAEGKRRAAYLEQRLQEHGIHVLRNEVLHLKANNAQRPLAIVGLDDDWSGHMDADEAFAQVDASLPVICLNHNPANVMDLMDYPWQWMLSGHTHGRQLGTSRIGRRFLASRYRRYTHGYYCVNGRHLYVNRGLSYGRRMVQTCRPEVTVFKLEVDHD